MEERSNNTNNNRSSATNNGISNYEERIKVASSFLTQTATTDKTPLKLNYTHIVNERRPAVASLVIIHGLGQYSELYYEFAEYFASFNYACHLIDLRGFGYSGGAKGLSDFEDMIKDIELIFAQVRKDIPLYLCGHSLGATLLLAIGQRSRHLKITGIIALAPLLDPNRHGYGKTNGIISKVTSYGVRLLGELIGEIAQSNWTLQQSTRRSKPLMVQNIGLTTVKSLLKGIRGLNENSNRFQFPLFVVQGNSDCVCSVRHTENFFDSISSEDKALQIIPNMSHELIQDDTNGRVKLEVLAWMQLRLRNAKPFAEQSISLRTIRQTSPKWRLLKILMTMIFAKTISNISLFYKKGILFQKLMKIVRLLQTVFIM